MATALPRSRTLTTPADLIAAGLSAPSRARELEAVAERYALAVPPALAALIDPNDPADPIARQFLPIPANSIAGRPNSTIPSATRRRPPCPAWCTAIAIACC